MLTSISVLRYNGSGYRNVPHGNPIRLGNKNNKVILLRQGGRFCILTINNLADLEEVSTAITQKECRRKYRLEVIEAYGGKCVCCGTDELAWLSLDHIYNDGAEHRKELSTGVARIGASEFYRLIRKQGFPKGRLQVLCYNCNLSKQFAPNGCPHRFNNSLKAKEENGV